MINYGINLKTKQPIVLDRTKFNKGLHRAILGRSGIQSLLKSEVSQLLDTTEDIVYILDSRGTFRSLVNNTDSYCTRIALNSIGGIEPIEVPKNQRFVIIDISGFEDCTTSIELKREAISLCLNTIWKAIEVTYLHSRDRHFWLFIDDIYPILRASCDKLFATFLSSCKSKNCLVTYGGQFVSDLNTVTHGKTILENTSMFTLLQQLRKNDIAYLKMLFNLTELEINSLTTKRDLSGIFCINTERIPFKLKIKQNQLSNLIEECSYGYA